MIDLCFLSSGGVQTNIFLGMDLDSLISVLSSILAAALFLISLLAYLRDRRRRLLFVTGAFFLFAIRGFLIVISDYSIPGAVWIDSLANLLDFGVLLLFFLGLIKK
jgi:hydrogenase/urease accessory protein HupE